MISLRLALGSLAAMAVATAWTGGLAVIDYHGRFDAAAPPLVLTAGDRSPYWQALVSGARAAAHAEHVPLTVTWPSEEDHCEANPLSASGPSRPAQRFGRIIGRYPPEPDAVLVAQFGTLETAISNDASDDAAKYLFHVGMANYPAGRNCAALARELLPRGGTVIAWIESRPSSEASISLNGLREELRRCGQSADAAEIHLVVHRAAPDSSTTGGELAEEVRRRNAQFVVDLTGQPVERILTSLEALPANERPGVITFDSSEHALAAIEMGKVQAVVTTDSFQCGYQAVARMALLQRRDPCELPVDGRGSILLPSLVVRQEDIAEFRASRQTVVQNP